MSPSPTALKSLVVTLITSLRTCDDLIEDIRVNRRLPETTEKLDRLQDTLQASQSTIERSYTSWRRIIGSRMDLGDAIARSSLEVAIRDLQSTVQKKLKDVAQNRVRERGEKELPGFSELWRRWCAIDQAVISAIDSCGRRFESAAQNQAPPQPRPQSLPQPQQPQRPALKPDEEIISSGQLTAYMNHMRNSWIEKSLPGRGTCFVNVFDDKVVRFERPDGFVKALPAQRRQAYVEDWDESDDQSSVRDARSRY